MDHSDLEQSNIGPNDFDILKVLGRGGFGKVMQVRKNNGMDAGMVFAMKTIKKSRILRSQKDMDHTKTERKVLEISSVSILPSVF